jgi:hypothetical protein
LITFVTELPPALLDFLSMAASSESPAGTRAPGNSKGSHM